MKNDVGVSPLITRGINEERVCASARPRTFGGITKGSRGGRARCSDLHLVCAYTYTYMTLTLRATAFYVYLVEPQPVDSSQLFFLLPPPPPSSRQSAPVSHSRLQARRYSASIFRNERGLIELLHYAILRARAGAPEAKADEIMCGRAAALLFDVMATRPAALAMDFTKNTNSFCPCLLLPLPRLYSRRGTRCVTRRPIDSELNR